MNLNTVRVFVTDLARAKAFYAHVLGLKINADGAAHGYVVFNAGNVELVIEAVEAGAPDDEQALVGRFTGLSFRVDDVRATYAALRAKGVSFAGPPELQFWGGTLATFTDPDGNALQLVQRPA